MSYRSILMHLLEGNAVVVEKDRTYTTVRVCLYRELAKINESRELLGLKKHDVRFSMTLTDAGYRIVATKNVKDKVKFSVVESKDEN